MRLLLIERDPRFRSLLRHHVTCRWPDADVVAYDPVRRGPLAPEFLAQGYDAVLLDADTGDDGWAWLQDLGSRRGFAPLLLVADEGEAISRRAHELGALAVVGRSRIAHARLIAEIEQAAARQARQRHAWQASAAGRDARCFGSAVLDGFRRIRRLAAGRTTETWLAESEQWADLVALKVAREPRPAVGPDRAHRRFGYELAIARGVRHPGIVRLHDVGVSEGHAFLVMEYFRAGSLHARMRSGIAVRDALRLAADAARALAALHAAGVLHLDLKPANMMLRDDGSLALIDFGISRHGAHDLEISDNIQIAGTPHYMSPEQGHGEPLDFRADLYSLGIVLYEMLCGRKPYLSDNPMAIIYLHRKAPVPTLPPSLAALQPIVDRLLAKRPDERYPSAAAAGAALAEALRHPALPQDVVIADTARLRALNAADA